MAERQQPILKLVNLTKRYGKNTVLDGLSLEIYSGEIFGVIGLSGTGKTTLLNLIVGYITPNVGDVFFKKNSDLHYDDAYFSSVLDSTHNVKSSFGFASQEPSFYEKLTVMENLKYFGALYGMKKKKIVENANRILKLVGLNESVDVLGGNLSGGMQKRLDIACALIHDPKLLILDEPTSDLDPLLRKQMWSLIKSINEMGTTIILSSHFLDEIELLCNRVAILYNKKIGLLGTPDEIREKFSKYIEIKLVTKNSKYKELIKEFVKNKDKDLLEEYHVERNTLYIKTSDTENALRDILEFIPKIDDHILELEVERPSLKEALEEVVYRGNKK